jgi:hypothetical protein
MRLSVWFRSLLLFHKFDLNWRQVGSTALIIAAERGNSNCARLLIDSGADKEAKDKVCNGRCFAAAFFLVMLIWFPVSVYSFFLSEFSSIWRSRCMFGGDSNSQSGSTPLILAARNGRADCVRLLLEAGADRDATNKVHDRYR